MEKQESGVRIQNTEYTAETRCYAVFFWLLTPGS
jgi:hypothetical protein